MRAERKYKILLAVEKFDWITVVDVQCTVGYHWAASAAKACLELYRTGYLSREDVPKNEGTGGHKYVYRLTNKGKEKVKWIHAQGYNLN